MIYTGEERPERLQGTLGIGAGGLVRKKAAEGLEEALTAVVNGEHGWVSPLMASVVLAPPGQRLSSAQVKVLRLYSTSMTPQKIASVRRCLGDGQEPFEGGESPT